MEKRRNFSLFSTIFCYLFLDFHVKTGTRISLRDKRVIRDKRGRDNESRLCLIKLTPYHTHPGIWTTPLSHLVKNCELGGKLGALRSKIAFCASDLSLHSLLRHRFPNTRTQENAINRPQLIPDETNFTIISVKRLIWNKVMCHGNPVLLGQSVKVFQSLILHSSRKKPHLNADVKIEGCNQPHILSGRYELLPSTRYMRLPQLFYCESIETRLRGRICWFAPTWFVHELSTLFV